MCYNHRGAAPHERSRTRSVAGVPKAANTHIISPPSDTTLLRKGQQGTASLRQLTLLSLAELETRDFGSRLTGAAALHSRCLSHHPEFPQQQALILHGSA